MEELPLMLATRKGRGGIALTKKPLGIAPEERGGREGGEEKWGGLGLNFGSAPSVL